MYKLLLRTLTFSLVCCSATLFGQVSDEVVIEIDEKNDEKIDEKQEAKTSKTEVLLILDSRAFDSSLQNLESKTQYASSFQSNNHLNNTKLALPSDFNFTSIRRFMIDITNENIYHPEYYISDIDLKFNKDRSLLLETLLKMSYENAIDEKLLPIKLSQIIGEAFINEEARYDFLSLMADRLYQNYNDARNPFNNNTVTNPNDEILPEGNISISNLFKAAFENDIYRGGVCNDIAQVVADIGQHLFPDKDVLVISGGTHIGTIITDGETSRVIDGGSQLVTHNMLSLHPNITHASNIRISKVVNGKLREIAILDTEQGLLVKSALGIDKDTISTNWPMNKIITQVSKVIETKKMKKEFSLSTAAAELSRSNMFVIAGKVDLTKKSRHAFAGVAYGHQTSPGIDTLDNGDGSIHVHIGYDRKYVLYAHPRLKLEFVSGFYAQGNFGLKRHRFDTAGTIESEKALNVQFKPKDESGLKIDSKVTLISSLGPKDYGKTTGILSKFQLSDLPKFALGMIYHLNQFVVNTKVEKNINSRLSAQGQFLYQGTHVGQNIESNLGVTILSKNKNHQFYAFLGYDNSDLKGYKTRNNLLAGYTGGKLGVQYQNNSGTRLELSLREIGNSSQNPYFNGTVKLPLYSASKKKLNKN
jgi:hypothetical protein